MREHPENGANRGQARIPEPHGSGYPLTALRAEQQDPPPTGLRPWLLTDLRAMTSSLGILSHIIAGPVMLKPVSTGFH
jgi:hypothetical protein